MGRVRACFCVVALGKKTVQSVDLLDAVRRLAVNSKAQGARAAATLCVWGATSVTSDALDQAIACWFTNSVSESRLSITVAAHSADENGTWMRAAAAVETSRTRVDIQVRTMKRIHSWRLLLSDDL